MYYVYCLKSEKDGSLYFGYSNDLKRRLVEHNDMQNVSTRHKAPFKLVYYEAYNAQADAKFRENQLKRFGQASKALKQRISNSLLG